MLIFPAPLGVTKAEFKLKGDAVILTLASAVSVTNPLAKVNGSEPTITLALEPVAVEAPNDIVNALADTFIFTLPTVLGIVEKATSENDDVPKSIVYAPLSMMLLPSIAAHSWIAW